VIFYRAITFLKSCLFGTTFFCCCFRLFALFIISFLAWNYFGLLSVVSLILIYHAILLVDYKNYLFFILGVFINMVTFHFATLFWVLQIDALQGFSILLFHSIYYTIPLCLLYWFRNLNLIRIYVFSLIWLLIEISRNFGELSFPWNILGNALGVNNSLVQWYSFTGVYGGSIFVLIIFMVFNCGVYGFKNNLTRKFVTLFVVSITLYSLGTYYLKSDFTNNQLKIIAVNSTKAGNYNKFKDIFYKLETINERIDFVISPELEFKNLPLNYNDSQPYSYFTENFFMKQNNSLILFGNEFYGESLKFNATLITSQDKSYFKVKEKNVPVTENVPVFLRWIIDDGYTNVTAFTRVPQTL